MRLLIVGTLNVAFLAINFLLRLGVKKLSRRIRLLNYLKRPLPVLEMAFWSFFLVWSGNLLLQTSPFHFYFNLLVFVSFFISVGWFLLRDFLAGVQIKTRFPLDKGQNFNAGSFKGEIAKVGLLTLSLQNDKTGDVIIPYHKIDQSAILLNRKKQVDGVTNFTVELSITFNEKNVRKKIEELVMNSAWYLPKSKPTIAYLGKHANKHRYEISCAMQSSEAPMKISMMLERALNKS
jgi:hypothetical protein